MEVIKSSVMILVEKSRLSCRPFHASVGLRAVACSTHRVEKSDTALLFETIWADNCLFNRGGGKEAMTG
jgi:hypothetical protein